MTRWWPSSTKATAPSSSGTGGSPRVGVGGVDFDRFETSGSPTHPESPLHVRLNDGSFSSGFGNALGTTGWLGDVLAARNGYVWCAMPRGQGVLVYDTNETPGDTKTTIGASSLPIQPKGLPSDDIYVLRKTSMEKSGLERLRDRASSTCPALFLTADMKTPSLHKSSFNKMAITSCCWRQRQSRPSALMAATASGLERKLRCVLVEPGRHRPGGAFHSANSPLLSNQVTDIALNHRNGEVLIGTQRGLMDGAAMQAISVEEIGALRVYPNPVEADFEGLVTVEGLAYTPTVHITTLSGRAVATMQSEGGRRSGIRATLQAHWSCMVCTWYSRQMPPVLRPE